MKPNIALLSPAFFVVVLISFLLPWVSFSCNGHTFASATGLDLVTGTTFDRPTAEGEVEAGKYPSDSLAVVTLALTTIGLVLALLHRRVSLIFPAISAAAGLVGLLLLRARLDSDAAVQTHGMLEPEFEFGFWLAFLGLLGSALLNGYAFIEKRNAGISSPPPL